jgi:hypothetical protein
MGAVRFFRFIRPNWRCCCHDMAGIRRRLLADGKSDDLCIVSISDPSCDCSFNNCFHDKNA